ncbi:MAG: AarF/ABC1/UbiB kinase family protein [Desulfobacteraceae bacterium]|nr:AarF/ABC1/UbiB kinase family protein [Desulfobacteraceae bacterium]
MLLSRGIRGLKGIRRFGAISRVLLKHGFGDLAGRLFNGKDVSAGLSSDKESFLLHGFPSARRIRLVLEELGPSFVKLGQLMSTRADLFPPEYITEFKKLQDRVPPVSFAGVKAVIEQEINKPLDAIFAEFDETCLAAASVGQVHNARLHSGEKVAVKVIRPGIEHRIREDLRLMYFLAARIERSLEIGKVVGAVNLVREFERNIVRELDMTVEAGSIEKFAQNFKGVDEIYIPKVYWDYTTRSVLVMEHIDGIKMDQVEEIRARGIDPGAIALIGLRSFSRQLMEYGFFHADPHPGNTIVMFDGRVSLVDFGITGYLDEEMMHQIANLFLGYAEHDYDLVMDALLDAGLVNEDMDLHAFRGDLKDASEPFYGRSLQHIEAKDVYDQMMRLVLKYHIRLPRNLLLLFKTFIQTEALGKILGSDASILQVTRPFARKLLQKGYDTRSLRKNLGREARTLGGYLKNYPKYLGDILRQTATGKQRLEFHHTGFDKMQRQVERGVNRLTVGIVIAASIIAAAMILNSNQKVIDLSIGLLGHQTVSLTALLGIVGYVVATLLGIWLIISILRSGRL